MRRWQRREDMHENGMQGDQRVPSRSHWLLRDARGRGSRDGMKHCFPHVHNKLNFGWRERIPRAGEGGLRATGETGGDEKGKRGGCRPPSVVDEIRRRWWWCCMGQSRTRRRYLVQSKRMHGLDGLSLGCGVPMCGVSSRLQDLPLYGCDKKTEPPPMAKRTLGWLAAG